MAASVGPRDSQNTDSNSGEKRHFIKRNAQFCANTSDSDTGKQSDNEPVKKWGFDLYPERRGEYNPSWKKVVFYGEGREENDRIKCERKIYWCLQHSHLVKLMLSALKSSGCEVDIRRHFSCEVCDPSVTGGYDSEFNQVIICQNTAKKKGVIQGVLTHELIHMFDFCRAKLDFTNIKHLACTEIRAANLAHCSFMSAMMTGSASPFNVAKRHAECVKEKAAASVMAVRRVSEEEAREVVNSVFDKCYNDLEPIGRRIRRGTRDMEHAYKERFLMGYCD